MRAADYISKHSLPPLSNIEEQRLGRKSCQGDLEARDKLVAHNLLFALSASGSWSRDSKYKSMADDIDQEAVTALTEAASTYNGAIRFAAYASRLIRWRIMKMLDAASGDVKLHYNTAAYYRIVRRQFDKLREGTQQMPTVEDVIEALDGEVVPSLVRAIMEMRPPLEMDMSFTSTSNGFESVDRHELVDLSLGGAEKPSDKVMQSDADEKMSEALKIALEPSEYELISKFYGLDGIEPVTLREMAAEEGVTPQLFSYRMGEAYKRIRARAGQLGEKADACRKLLTIWEDIDD